MDRVGSGRPDGFGRERQGQIGHEMRVLCRLSCSSISRVET